VPDFGGYVAPAAVAPPDADAVSRREPFRLLLPVSPHRRFALAPWSYLVLTHICAELLPDKAAARRAKDGYEQAGQPISARGTEQIRGFFGDFELVEPGLVPKHAWRPDTGVAADDPSDISLGGVARKIA
jgi:hypothetical protein